MRYSSISHSFINVPTAVKPMADIPNFNAKERQNSSQVDMDSVRYSTGYSLTPRMAHPVRHENTFSRRVLGLLMYSELAI